MKTVKSFAKIIIALLMALTLVTLTACDVLDDFFGNGGEEGGTGDGNLYNVALEPNGGNFTENVTQYTSGTACTLPTNGTKEHYTFDGWYADGSFSGNRVLQIPTGATGDKTYYAKWSPENYNLTFTIKDDSYQSPITSYNYGEEVTLPTPTKSGSTFNGWFANSNLTGEKVTQIAAGESGAKSFYGEWKSGGSSVTPTKSTVILNLDGGQFVNGGLSQYTEGEETTLPEAKRDGYTFNGWLDGNGKLVRSIPASAKGALSFTASWTKVSTDTLTITSSAGYQEGAYVEFNTVKNVSTYTVAYKTKTGSEKYTEIDSQLVRVNDSAGTVRADVVGIKEGEYTLQVTAGSQIKTTDVSVTSYDRSGYAHFNYTSGVGAYNDDGTPKSGANIVYVNEGNKNTVKATIDGKSYTGIVSILQNAGTKTPLIVRIIGQISAATWKEGNVTYTKTTQNTVDGTDKGNLKEEVIVGKNGKRLPTSSSDLTQDKLIAGKYNELDTSKYSILNGLSSKATYKVDSKTNLGAYDSAWNNCSISGVKNVTLEGIGNDAEIFQWGLTWASCNSIEVRNITFDDYTEDACSFEGSTNAKAADDFNSKRLWIHNCTINQGINYWDVSDEQDKHEGDGGTDFKKVSYVTISYVHYYNNHKTGLIGGSDDQTTANVTFHHNYYQQCSSRLPLGRQANMHMYNNYYYKSTGTNMSLRAGAYAFIESCYFDNANNPVTTQDGDKKKGVAKMFNCTVTGSGSKALNTKDYNITVVTNRTTKVTNDNIFNKNFDTESSVFYYDSSAMCSKVTVMHTAEQTKSLVPTLAGVHKNKKN